jgi:lipase chaperone LimK
LVLAVGGMALRWRPPPAVDAPTVDVAVPPAVAATAEPSSPAVSPQTTEPVAPPRPRSLRGTRVDGDLEVDPLGHFRPSVNASRLFDYHLTATGEASLDDLRARIVGVIDRRLPAAAARDAVDLLDRYLLYRERARQLADAGLGDDDYHARFAAIWALRREVLGTADAEALFGEEETYDRLALERARIMSNPFLSDEDRAEQLPAVDAAMPEPMRAARDAATMPMRLGAAEQAVRQAGGSAADVEALRAEVVGAEAAQRLAALDAERAAWQTRVDEFRAARAAIEDDGSQSSDDRARAIAALLAERFTPPERVHIEALDRLATR